MLNAYSVKLKVSSLFACFGANIIKFVARRHRDVMNGGAKRDLTRIRGIETTIDQYSCSRLGTVDVAEICREFAK